MTLYAIKFNFVFCFVLFLIFFGIFFFATGSWLFACLTSAAIALVSFIFFLFFGPDLDYDYSMPITVKQKYNMYDQKEKK